MAYGLWAIGHALWEQKIGSEVVEKMLDCTREVTFFLLIQESGETTQCSG